MLKLLLLAALLAAALDAQTGGAFASANANRLMGRRLSSCVMADGQTYVWNDGQQRFICAAGGSGGGTGNVSTTAPATFGPFAYNYAVSTVTLPSGQTLTLPTISATGWSNAVHAHLAANSGGQLSEAALNLTDITTGNVSNLKHGFLKKLSNVPSEFLNGQGNFVVPPGGGDVSTTSNATFGAFTYNYTAATVTLPSGQTLTLPTISATGWTNAVHGHLAANSGGQLGEGALLLTDVATNNASTSNHGFLKKLSNVAGEFMNGQGNWATVHCTSTASSFQWNNAGALGCISTWTTNGTNVTASGSIDFTAATFGTPASIARTDTSSSNSSGVKWTTALSSTTAGLRVTAGTLPSSQATGDLFMDSAGVLGKNDGTNADALVSFAGSGAAFGTAPTSGHMVKWGSNYKLTSTGSATWANSDLPASLLATGTSVSLTAPRQYYICTGTCTVTPPVPAAGYEFCVLNGDNVATVITMAAIGSSARYENTARTAYGTAGTGTFVSGAAAGNKVCLLGLDSTHYLTVSYQGTWTAN